MDSPKKHHIKDILNKPTPFTVWIQGNIEQVVKNEILIITDGTAHAKITKCENADGIIDKNSLQKGTYCCIIGTAVNAKGLPEIQVSKFIDLSSKPQMKAAWDYEVQESNLILQGKLHPSE